MNNDSDASLTHYSRKIMVLGSWANDKEMRASLNVCRYRIHRFHQVALVLSCTNFRVRCVDILRHADVIYPQVGVRNNCLPFSRADFGSGFSDLKKLVRRP